MTEPSKNVDRAATPRPSATDGAPTLDGKATALAVAEAALDKKAQQIEVIDLRGIVDYADFVVVASGRSDRQVAAIAKGIEDDLKAQHGIRCLGVEGLPQGRWVLMDFSDVIVHVFHQDTRGYYDLESLWIDAARVDLEIPGREQEIAEANREYAFDDD
ncbi:MAG: ribosome silencing factor [Myxococcota bacterium]